MSKKVVYVGKDLESMSFAVNYHKWILEEFRPFLGKKLVEVGEVIAARSPVLVVTDLSAVWADVFVPEPTVPRIKLGQPATVFTDAGGSGLPGTVTYISPKAEFTPRNVQTSEERSKLVYRIRVSVDNKDGVLKQGMPVEAELPQ